MSLPKVGELAVVDGKRYTISDVDDLRIVCKDSVRLDWEAAEHPVGEGVEPLDAGVRISVPLRALYFHEGFEVWTIAGRENPRTSTGGLKRG